MLCILYTHTLNCCSLPNVPLMVYMYLELLEVFFFFHLMLICLFRMQRKNGQFAPKETTEEVVSASSGFNSSESLQENTRQITE